jgi:MscS family membrane protein
LAWFLLRLIHNVTHNIVAARVEVGETVDHTTVDALSKLARFSIIIVATLVIMQTLGFSITGLLTFGGIGGIAVGFAAKDILANFFGGLTIYLDRPFVVGEWIRSPDKEIEGTVEYIGWRHTRVRAFNKNPIYVPNALFTTIVLENPTRMTNRRIKETIGIRYDDLAQMAPIVADVRAMLISHPEIDTAQTLIVNFTTFGPSSLDFFIYTFTKTKDWVRYHEVKQDVLLKVADIIARHGAEIAFPTRTLHIDYPPPAPTQATPAET